MFELVVFVGARGGTADLTQYSTLDPATVWPALFRGCFNLETPPHLHTLKSDIELKFIFQF